MLEITSSMQTKFLVTRGPHQPYVQVEPVPVAPLAGEVDPPPLALAKNGIVDAQKVSVDHAPLALGIEGPRVPHDDARAEDRERELRLPNRLSASHFVDS